MKKRLLRGDVLALLLVVIITMLVAVPLVSSQMEKQIKARLDASLALLCADINDILADPQGICSSAAESLKSAGQDIRLTIIASDGNVLGDSQTDIQTAQNHLDRPEIVQAKAEGKGADKRKSATLNEKMYYIAIYQNDVFIRAAVSMNEVDQIKAALLISVFIGLLAGLLAAVVSVYHSSIRIVRPIQEVTLAAKDISSGNYGAKVSAYDDELGELAKAFNVMSGNLQNAVEDLKDKQTQLTSLLQAMDDGVMQINNEGRIMLFNERARELLSCPDMREGDSLAGSVALIKLKETLSKIDESCDSIKDVMMLSSPSDRILNIYAVKIHTTECRCVLAVLSDITHLRHLEELRSQFVSNVTHELKTPLTSIRGFIELLKNGDRDEETRRYFYDVLDIEAQRLQNLISDMLSLSEIEHSVDDGESVRCSLRTVIDRTVSGLEMHAEKAQVHIQVSGDKEIDTIASPHRLRQLFGNLIVNAIKYNKKDGNVSISISKEGRMAVTVVADTGIGIPAQHHERLFERFYRVDKSRSREMGGTGLGLSIVKHLVNLYGGQILLESEDGAGSTFTVKLPLAPPEEEE